MLHETQISGGGTDTVRAFRKTYIMNAIENMESAWNEVWNTTLSAAWKNIWPECCQSSSTSILFPTSEAQTDIQEEILQLGRSLDGEGFADLFV
ncbi:putative DDE superfamily endonuclease [Trypoxylus dichotomus]